MKTLLTLLLSLTFSVAFGQLVPYGLQLDKVRKEILQKTAEFDSLVLTDKASYWSDDKTINGFGFKNNETYSVTIIFQKGDSSFYDMTVDKLKKSKATDQSQIDAIKKINYPIVSIFSNDSLNLKSRTNSSMQISDMPEWTILIIKKNEFTLRQSYAPEFYQGQAPTKERQTFMDIVAKLDKLIK